MYNFTPDAILMVLTSNYFDSNDYIYEKYITSSQEQEARQEVESLSI
jgi:hypothetical protein